MIAIVMITMMATMIMILATMVVMITIAMISIMLIGTTRLRPVSYTHLTLPTIYSV